MSAITNIENAIKNIPLMQKFILISLLAVLIVSFAYPNWWLWVVPASYIQWVWIIGALAGMVFVMIMISNPSFLAQIRGNTVK